MIERNPFIDAKFAIIKKTSVLRFLFYNLRFDFIFILIVKI